LRSACGRAGERFKPIDVFVYLYAANYRCFLHTRFEDRTTTTKPARGFGGQLKFSASAPSNVTRIIPARINNRIAAPARQDTFFVFAFRGNRAPSTAVVFRRRVEFKAKNKQKKLDESVRPTK